jgi:hypothetical protein
MKKNLILLTIGLMIMGCHQKPTADDLIEKSMNVYGSDTIETIQTIANCQSPEGNYTTEIHSAKDDYTYFKQVYSYQIIPFEAVVLGLDTGFQLHPDSSLTELRSGDIHIIKGHEFHEILFELNKRFHQFGEPESVMEESMKLFRVAALDMLNNPVELFFHQQAGTLESMTFLNPDDTNEVIRITYSNRKQIQGIFLPMHVEILQGDKKFSFDYTSIKINAVDFKPWKRWD